MTVEAFDPEGVDKVAEAMARKYEELGLTVTKKRFDERARLHVWKSETIRRKSLLIF